MKSGGIKTTFPSKNALHFLNTIFIFFPLAQTIFLQVLKTLPTTMVKSSISRKQSKGFGSARPTGSESIIKDQSPSIASSNFSAIFADHTSYNDAINLMIQFLSKHLLFGLYNAFTKVIPLPTLFKCAFSTFRPSHNLQEVHLNLVDDSFVVLPKAKFPEAINLRIMSITKFFSPGHNGVISNMY